MMKVLLATALLLLLGSCTDPITVGSDLLGDDRAEVGEVTNLPFTTRVIRDDSSLTVQNTTATTSSGYSFGQVEDMTFGLTRHSLYLTARPPVGATQLTAVPQFARNASVLIDSAVLILPIDTLKPFYGPGREFPVRVLELADAVSGIGSFYSDIELATRGGDLSAQSTFTATATPTLVRDTAVTDGEQLLPHVRIRLNDEFVDKFDGLGTDAFSTDSIFRLNFPGILVEPAGTSDGLVYVLPTTQQSGTAIQGLNIYYRDTSGVQMTYRIGFRQVLPNYSYDYSGSLVETLLETDTTQDLIAVAGESSITTEITLTDLASLAGRIINRAELILPVAQVAGVNYGDYPLPSRVELSYRTGDGTLNPITDRLELIRSQARPEAVNFLIGGQLAEEDGLRLYSPAFSVHLQRMVEGEVPPRIFLRVTPLVNSELRAARALLNGPTDPVRPARIQVTFTNID